ncbi:MAG: helix-turn-helix transcriptional regulator [Candidatus Cloacimonetes bacterium]|jgi:transcriptional regulator with XRE-family HTH domain|nr:helix-turn-helix transcriptional regulator [Candidatus Cloacimonadota bacterium]HOE90996.1 helix-turn-helix transcriptional regulator [Candidatus Cloacimonadota bacterium]HPK40518.1 helix-turn-helix transcriptional regulator [Candidatus Cloacimonadota bacterium]
MKTGDRLKEIRRKLKLSQIAFSDSIGVTQPAISLMEKNASAPSAEVLNNIRKTYNIDLNWLLSGQGEMFLTKIEEKSTIETRLIQSRDELQKQINQLKKSIAELETAYSQEKEYSRQLNQELAQCMKDLVSTQKLIIDLQKR